MAPSGPNCHQFENLNFYILEFVSKISMLLKRSKELSSLIAKDKIVKFYQSSSVYYFLN